MVVPLGAAAFDAACAPVSALTLGGLLPGARAAAIVGSGGPAFFDRFARCQSGGRRRRAAPARPVHEAHRGQRCCRRAVRARRRARGLLSVRRRRTAHSVPAPRARGRTGWARAARAANSPGVRAVVGLPRARRRRSRPPAAAAHRRRLRRMRRALRRRVPGARGRARRLHGRRLSRASLDRRTLPPVVRGADRLCARPGTSLHRRAARLSHGGVDAETLAARLTAHYSRSPWLR